VTQIFLYFAEICNEQPEEEQNLDLTEEAEKKEEDHHHHDDHGHGHSHSPRNYNKLMTPQEYVEPIADRR
jgi:hypothetical protein